MVDLMAEFLSAPAARPSSPQGNTPYAAKIAREAADVVRRYSDRRPRSMQKHLGPSELGVSCDRQIVGKLLGEEKTNHVTDPWPSFVGTAIHAELEAAFQWDDQERYVAEGQRWHTERRVTPHPDHAGTADLYDAHEFSLIDHKALGETTGRKVKSAEGPPRKYVAQMGLYGIGYLKLGFRVDRVVLLAWPRTGSSLDGVYAWEKAMDLEMFQLVADVLKQTDFRKTLAGMVEQGILTLDQVPRSPSGDECYLCPFYRPQAAHDGGSGCPGTVQTT